MQTSEQYSSAALVTLSAFYESYLLTASHGQMLTQTLEQTAEQNDTNMTDSMISNMRLSTPGTD